MSITTSQRMNGSDVQANLPVGTGFTAVGARLTDAAAKTITPIGTDDATLQAAITAAVAGFIDLDANRATLKQRAQAALATNANFLAIGTSPTANQVRDQVIALTKEASGIIRLLLDAVDSLNGTN